MIDKVDKFAWLDKWPNLKSQLNMIVTGLRRKQLTGSLPCAKATLEFIRSIFGTCKFKSTLQMMEAARLIGHEFMEAAPSELSIANIIKRVLFLIREEYATKLKEEESRHLITSHTSTTTTTTTTAPVSVSVSVSKDNKSRHISKSFVDIQIPSTPTTAPTTTTRTTTGVTTVTAGTTQQSQQQNENEYHAYVDLESMNHDNDHTTTTATTTAASTVPTSGGVVSSSTTTTTTTTSITTSIHHSMIGESSSSSSHDDQDVVGDLPMDSSYADSHHDKKLSTILSQVDTLSRVFSDVSIKLDNNNLLDDPNETNDFTRMFHDMRQSVVAAIAEINEELDNLYAPMCEQAQEHIHADECILVYGYTTMIELFLKAAAKKRRFQVIIAEASPLLSGIKLANSLSKITNISTTLIPDSNIYAIMSRVNKVILAPHAVMMDGGCMCTSGHLMVTIAAKECAVPVICLAGAYILTPRLAHNEKLAYDQVLNPSSIISYSAPVHFDNVQVYVPAYDHIPPDMIDLFVTNNGSHQPSYIYRLLSELYHPHDYIL